MSTLFNAVSNRTVTENGCATNVSSLDPCVDMFFKFTQYRREEIAQDLRKALSADAKTALQILFWGRDCRTGAGERLAFRKGLKWLATNCPGYVATNIELIPKYGRWDDVLELIGTPVEGQALSFYADALRDGDGLAAKWAPRRKAGFYKLAKTMGLCESKFRKLIVGLSKTVEQDMCAQRWEAIKYSSVPSVAMSRYGKAFGRNDNGRFVEFINRVKEGKETIKAGAVFPHDIIRGLRNRNASADVQWNALPDLFEGKRRNILPVVDVSGSMCVRVSGEIQAIDIALGLGIYCAERNEGQFKNQFVTFSGRPEFLDIGKYKTLSEKMKYMERSNWGMNTDLDAVFKTILKTAVDNKLAQSELPDAILIVSDMHFDGCINGCEETAYQRTAHLYAASGYTMPKVVFWNVNGRGSNFPVLRNQGNTALITGFSPQVLKGVLSGDVTDPRTVMLNTVSKYEVAV